MTNEIKMIVAARRGASMSREALFDQWEHAHAPFVARHAEPERYLITFFEGRVDGSESPYDGLVEMWFRDREHSDAWYHGSQRGSDGFGEFTDSSVGFRLATTEYLMVDGDENRDNEKVIYLVKRRSDVLPAQFFHHWREIHAPNVRAGVERTDGCLRYTVSHANLGEVGTYDGVAEIWWRDDEARQRGLEGVEEDGFGRLIDRDSTVVLLGHEFAVVEQ